MTDEHDDTPHPAAAPRRGGRAELRRVLARVRGHVRLSRGRGGHALDAVLARVRGDLPLDDADEQRLAHVIESLVFAVEDAEAAARRSRPHW